MLGRSKLNRIESKISKASMVNEISHEDFETIINEEKNIDLKERVRMMNSQRSDAEKTKTTSPPYSLKLFEKFQKV